MLSPAGRHSLGYACLPDGPRVSASLYAAADPQVNISRNPQPCRSGRQAQLEQRLRGLAATRL